jgi:hydroxymethylpyrimidine pyrophosphatase-like HAD family hydrolase
MVKMIALDLDGTLLAQDGRVGERNTAALLAAEAAGIVLVIATGRRHCYAMKVLREVGLGPETILVSSNGTVTRTTGDARLITRTEMPNEVALKLCRHLGDYRNALVVTFDRVTPDGEDETGALVVEEFAEVHASMSRWVEANQPYISHLKPIEQALSGPALIQMMLCGKVARMREAEARILEMEGVSAVGGDGVNAVITLHRTEYPERDLSIVDILPGGCSKGVALLRLAGSLDILPGEIMAIGDNWNDLSMLEVAGHPVLMGNAPEDLQQVARQRGWRLAGMHHEDGVAKVLEQLLSNQSPGRPTEGPSPLELATQGTPHEVVPAGY